MASVMNSVSALSAHSPKRGVAAGAGSVRSMFRVSLAAGASLRSTKRSSWRARCCCRRQRARQIFTHQLAPHGVPFLREMVVVLIPGALFFRGRGAQPRLVDEIHRGDAMPGERGLNRQIERPLAE